MKTFSFMSNTCQSYKLHLQTIKIETQDSQFTGPELRSVLLDTQDQILREICCTACNVFTLEDKIFSYFRKLSQNFMRARYWHQPFL